MKKHIPNFITCLNLISGFTAIILAFEGNIPAASWLILAAMIFDFLDGFSARLLRAYSDIGKELDSLADVVSFGVAPAIIIYDLLLTSGLFPEKDSIIIPYALIASIMPVAGALRLAKFNTDPSQATGFKGLPIPASALAVISLVLPEHYSDSELLTSGTGNAVFLIILTITLSLLMVSRLELFSLKTGNLKLRGNEGRYLMLVMIAIALLLFGVSGAILIIPVYIFCSLVSGLF